MITLDLPGGPLELSREDAVHLRDLAAAQAGSSSIARDCSLLLDRALTGSGRVTLRRSEQRALARLAADAGLADTAERLRRRPTAPS